MLAGGLPFLAYLRLLRKGSWRERIEPQAAVFLATVAVLAAGFAVWLNLQHGLGGFDSTTRAIFSIVSIVTTTGYASVDYVSWGTFATAFFFMLSFIGGCTGSTSGGVKILRYQIMFGIVAQHVRRSIHPHTVSPLRYGDRVITDDQAASVGTFFFVYLASFAAVAIMLALAGLDAPTSLSAAIATLGNVGPGVTEAIGPSGNYRVLPDTAKVVMSAAMIMGRLEVLSLLILFMPSFYR
jgi:trk system potassium uptake protein TrkH